MLLLCTSKFYDVFTICKTWKVPLEFENGEKRIINQAKIRVFFKHKRTKDMLEFTVTGKENYYEGTKESSEAKVMDEFIRLLDSKEQADLMLKKVKIRLAFGI